jgi:Ca2+-binding RTX toxin-like protein
MMTHYKLFNGTTNNDTVVGSPTEQNYFTDFGVGRDVLTGGKLDDVFMLTADKFVDTIDGGNGRDLVDYSAASSGLQIDLSAGAVMAGTVTVAKLSNIEDVNGTKLDDIIIGSKSDNTLDGGDGNDKISAGDGNDTLIGGAGTNYLDGGNGVDTVDYSKAGHTVFASLATNAGAEIDLVNGIMVSQDTYAHVENLHGSAYADTLIGNTGANAIDGGGGNDVIQGGGGGDTLHGGSGDDQIIGDNFNGVASDSTAYLYGDDGNDTLFASAGKDIMDGGTGNDWVDYSQTDPSHWTSGWTAGSAGVTVDLSAGVGHGSYAEGDTYTNIENVRGSNYDDNITGDANANILVGMSGDNVIHGGANNDTIIGGGDDDALFGDDGNDVLSGGTGTNHFDGGNGIDTVDYRGSAYNTIVDLTGSFFLSGEKDAQGHYYSADTYVSIENVEGSSHDDFIIGDDNDNVIHGNGGHDALFGRAGNDTIVGGDQNDLIDGGAGADILDGGKGVNVLSYLDSSAGVSVNLAAGTGAGGDATGDRFAHFQIVAGSSFNDVLIGSSNSDVLLEQAGINLMSGGAGHDTFAFMANLSGRDVIADFHMGEDRLAILGADSMSDLHISQSGANTIITFDNTAGAIMLDNVNAQDLIQHASTAFVFTDQDSITTLVQ